jgi:ABC-2 type transport system ATP-binding protein
MGSPDDLKDGVRGEAEAEPTLEDAFITLVERDDAASAEAAGAGRAAA